MGPNIKDFVWSYIAQIISIGGGIIALPLVLKYWDIIVIENYLILITLMALYAIIDGGLRINLVRITAFEKSGRIPIYGSTRDFVLENLTSQQLFNVINKLVFQISWIGGLFIFFLGSIYIYLTANQESFVENIFDWILLSISQILFCRNLGVIGVLQGIGKIALANKLVAAFKGSILLSCILAVLLGFNLSGFAIGAFFCSIIIYFITQVIFLKYTEVSQVTNENIHLSKSDINQIRLLIFKPSIRLWVVQVGAFLINRGNVLVAGLILGVSESSSFMLSIILISVAANLASSIILVYLPQINAIQVSDSRILLSSIIKKIYGIAYLIYVVAFIGIFFLGNFMLQLIGSEAKLIDSILLIIVGIISLLELNHSLAVSYLTTRNEIIFAKAALLSGLASVLMGFILGATYGVLGLILAQGGVQLLYNNWRWPQLMIRDLRTTINHD
tara:strand:- start:15416 stop:16753 length:1338 start_codon:yes stop_codon:yes gene_type:complete